MRANFPKLLHHFIDVFTTIWQDDDSHPSVTEPAKKTNDRIHSNQSLALNDAIENLYLLADLIEAHYVEHQHQRLQQKTMREARRLADMYRGMRDNPSAGYILDVQFELLARDLMTLKQCNLMTEAGDSWSDIMRQPVRSAALAIKSYQQLMSQNTELSLAVS